MGTTRAKSALAPQYLTRSEVARLFGVVPATIARWTREKKLPCVLTLGGQRRYLREEIMALLARSMQEARQ
jgi:excisionase family DNA binding protein